VQSQLSADEAATAPLALAPVNVVTCAMIVVWSATAGTVVYHCAGAPMLKLAPALTVGPLMAGDWYSKPYYGSAYRRHHHHHHHVHVVHVHGIGNDKESHCVSIRCAGRKVDICEHG
jgi:hypothetical protein